MIKFRRNVLWVAHPKRVACRTLLIYNLVQKKNQTSFPTLKTQTVQDLRQLFPAFALDQQCSCPTFGGCLVGRKTSSQHSAAGHRLFGSRGPRIGITDEHPLEILTMFWGVEFARLLCSCLEDKKYMLCVSPSAYTAGFSRTRNNITRYISIGDLPTVIQMLGDVMLAFDHFPEPTQAWQHYDATDCNRAQDVVRPSSSSTLVGNGFCVEWVATNRMLFLHGYKKKEEKKRAGSVAACHANEPVYRGWLDIDESNQVLFRLSGEPRTYSLDCSRKKSWLRRALHEGANWLPNIYVCSLLHKEKSPEQAAPASDCFDSCMPCPALARSNSKPHLDIVIVVPVDSLSRHGAHSACPQHPRVPIITSTSIQSGSYQSDQGIPQTVSHILLPAAQFSLWPISSSTTAHTLSSTISDILSHFLKYEPFCAPFSAFSSSLEPAPTLKLPPTNSSQPNPSSVLYPHQPSSLDPSKPLACLLLQRDTSPSSLPLHLITGTLSTLLAPELPSPPLIH
ncbi:hypothetical protein VP01_1066g1 [Puccinia sorghi]|uniref:Uncharacterized protein n=1 Tax=Puccinia sorghi TaxID=27349 RepID=A0A0L6VTQ5_9BASI|nr:hypothetical protein VP01_1066g1 [Puccinia sorghi]